ncbi:hypothetical protein [Treponema socranskii]|uniref:hypothetical protein n=1 Tax=Treponema socranskii TaxID=53419 RepID=UPI003D905DD2
MKPINKIVYHEQSFIKILKIIGLTVFLIFSIGTFIKGFDSFVSLICSLLCFFLSFPALIFTIMNWIVLTRKKILIIRFLSIKEIDIEDIFSIRLISKGSNNILCFSFWSNEKYEEIKVGSFFDINKIYNDINYLLINGKLSNDRLYEKQMRLFHNIILIFFLFLGVALITAFFLTFILFKYFIILQNRLLRTICITVFISSISLFIFSGLISLYLKRNK